MQTLNFVRSGIIRVPLSPDSDHRAGLVGDPPECPAANPALVCYLPGRPPLWVPDQQALNSTPCFFSFEKPRAWEYVYRYP